MTVMVDVFMNVGEVFKMLLFIVSLRFNAQRS
jgi:hypothetical protein